MEVFNFSWLLFCLSNVEVSSYTDASFVSLQSAKTPVILPGGYVFCYPGYNKPPCPPFLPSGTVKSVSANPWLGYRQTNAFPLECIYFPEKPKCSEIWKRLRQSQSPHTSTQQQTQSSAELEKTFPLECIYFPEKPKCSEIWERFRHSQSHGTSTQQQTQSSAELEKKSMLAENQPPSSLPLQKTEDSANEKKTVCKLPKDPGPCSRRNTYYYFNTKSRKCKKFIYGGCGGNGNAFKTIEECTKFCSASSETLPTEVEPAEITNELKKSQQAKFHTQIIPPKEPTMKSMLPPEMEKESSSEREEEIRSLLEDEGESDLNDLIHEGYKIFQQGKA